MAGAVWVMVAAGAFVLIVAALLVVLVVGRLRSRAPRAPFEGPHPHPRGEAIPPTGSR